MPKGRKIAILGVWPPPWGGMGMHIHRLCGLLAARGVDHVVYNAVSDTEGPNAVSVAAHRRSWLLGYAATGQEDTVYILSDRLPVWIAGAMMARLRGKRVLVRLRNSRLDDWLATSKWRARLAAEALRTIDGVVCVNKTLVQAALRAGVERSRIHHFPGFLPPNHTPGDRAGVDDTVWEFAADRHPLIAANGKVVWHNEQDLYGLDMILELAIRLAPDHPKLGVIVCFWDHLPGDQAYVDELMARAREAGVADRILLHTKPGLFVPLLAESTVFVRPTNTDGDANSIREALYLGTPAVASDVVQRPEGTLVFANRDMDGFELQVRKALAEPDADTGAKGRDPDHIDRYVRLVTGS